MTNATSAKEQAVPPVNDPKTDSYDTIKARHQAAKKRRSSDLEPPTIDNVRELLLGDTIKQSRQDMATIERKTHDQLGDLRVELGDRIDRVVRALSTVNQAVHKELNARDKAVEASAAEVTAKMEERISFLEAKIYTVVGDMERKLSAIQVADNDKLVDKLAEANDATEARLVELTRKVETQLDSFGVRISRDIAAVNSDIKAAQTETGDKLTTLDGQLVEKLTEIEAGMQNELGVMRRDVSNSAAEMRTELSAQASAQQGLLARSEADLQAKLHDHLNGLDGKKVSRADFSTLLHELAARIDEDKPAD